MATSSGSSHLRAQFLLRPDVVFLNHGSFGACPRPVFERYQAWQRELETQPVEFLGRRFGSLMLEARESLGQYLGCAADELLFVPNATTGLNIVARSLPLDPGDQVLTTDHEYGALDRTWRYVCHQRGARYVRKPLPLPLENRDQVIEAIWAGVSPRTRVLFLSHITSPTALILPVAELVRRARERRITTVIDGAHAPGQIELDLTALGADYYSGNCHKWLCAPKGSAFLYARRDRQTELQPLVVSWGWNREEQGCDGTVAPAGLVAEQEWQGTRDVSAYLSVPAAIQFQAENDWPAVRRSCHELLRRARRRIAGLSGLEQLCPDSPEWFAQMAAVPLPFCDAARLQTALYERFRIEVPITECNGRQYVRVSVQAYNDTSDVDALVTALIGLLGGPEFGQGRAG
ncbi:MAG: Isopenicillin N epimerase [Chloroflexi bacterium ADurb.Bin180]|nr:MAG: Isopenicillin N epimerase [Chloroflexi bacterium ADurb.Bin180]